MSVFGESCAISRLILKFFEKEVVGCDVGRSLENYLELSGRVTFLPEITFWTLKRGISKGISAKIIIFKEFVFFENKILPNLKIYLSDRSEFLEMKTYGTLP